jgi:hypothetical protein
LLLDGVKYAGRVEMSNSRTFGKKFINVFRSMCSTREEEPFNADDGDKLFHLVERLKMPFINDHQNDRNVYRLVMNDFNQLTIGDQVDRIPKYINIVNGDKGKVNGKVITSSYTELSTTKSPYITPDLEFGITMLREKSNANKDLITWNTYTIYLLDYVDFINKISCKTYDDTNIYQLTLDKLPLEPKQAPLEFKPFVGRLPKTPRERPASGGRRTKRAKHHRRTKRAKRSKRSKHTRRRKH